MFRLIALTAMMGLVVAVSVNTAARAEDKDEKTPTIKEVMKKLHGGKTALRAKVASNLKAKKWDDAADEVKTWVKLAEALPKSEPPKGESESWKKLTGSYEKAVKNLSEAVEKKNAKAATTAFNATGACKTCHTAHRGK